MELKSNWPISFTPDSTKVSKLSPLQPYSIDQISNFNRLEFPELESILKVCNTPGTNLKINSSGSTGEPKEIELNRDQLEYSSSRTNSELGISKDDIVLVCLPLDRIGGAMQVFRAYFGGYRLAFLPPSQDPFSRASLRNKQFNFNHCSLAPNQVLDIIKHKKKLSDLKTVLVGGAQLNSALEKAIIDSGLPAYQSFGMTETASHFALRQIGVDEQGMFRLLEGTEIKADKEGLLRVKSPATKNQWLETNDRVKILNESQFKWIGRSDFVINSGGIKVIPENLEKRLASILEERGFDGNFLISSVPDKNLGEKLVLILENFIPNEKWIKELLFYLKIELVGILKPTKIYNFNEFPKTSGGKIDRRRVQKMLRDSSRT